MYKLAGFLFFASWGRSVFQFFRSLGPIGLFLMAALDSSFLFLPFGNDLLLIALVSSQGNHGRWIIYVVVSALGSLAGVFVIDLLMRKAGEGGLQRFVKPKHINKLKNRLDKGVGWFVFTSTILPPPFPFTPVVMAASALQCSRKKLFLAVFAGRLTRFTIEAILALYFGRKLIKVLNSKFVDYFMYIFIAGAVIGSVFSVLKWIRKTKENRRPKKRKKKKS